MDSFAIHPEGEIPLPPQFEGELFRYAPGFVVQFKLGTSMTIGTPPPALDQAPASYRKGDVVICAALDDAAGEIPPHLAVFLDEPTPAWPPFSVVGRTNVNKLEKALEPHLGIFSDREIADTGIAVSFHVKQR